MALNTLETEAMAVGVLKNYIDDRFVEIVKLIHLSEGRVIITGIGKSAIVAQKIVATMNSTGTPSVFMHAAD
ncbi:MAG: D-arabinose 5-phosphate isomerase, partial [Bacteroidota bacterium]